MPLSGATVHSMPISDTQRVSTAAYSTITNITTFYLTEVAIRFDQCIYGLDIYSIDMDLKQVSYRETGKPPVLQ